MGKLLECNDLQALTPPADAQYLQHYYNVSLLAGWYV